MLAEHAPGEIGQRAFQVGEGDVFTHHQAFDLVELHFRAGRDLLEAVAHAGQGNADGGRVLGVLRRELAHRADLAGRGMRAQHHRIGIVLHSRFDVEGILHFAGRVVRRDVEQLEVVLIVSTSREVYT
jgi:hypothetical protein